MIGLPWLAVTTFYAGVLAGDYPVAFQVATYGIAPETDGSPCSLSPSTGRGLRSPAICPPEVHELFLSFMRLEVPSSAGSVQLVFGYGNLVFHQELLNESLGLIRAGVVAVPLRRWRRLRSRSATIASSWGRTERSPSEVVLARISIAGKLTYRIVSCPHHDFKYMGESGFNIIASPWQQTGIAYRHCLPGIHLPLFYL